MPHYVTTALGRVMPLEEWKEIHSDTVLRVLHDYCMSPFNPMKQPLPMRSLITATGLPPEDMLALCEALQTEGLTQLVGETSALITSKGIARVRNAPHLGTGALS